MSFTPYISFRSTKPVFIMVESIRVFHKFIPLVVLIIVTARFKFSSVLNPKQAGGGGGGGGGGRDSTPSWFFLNNF